MSKKASKPDISVSHQYTTGPKSHREHAKKIGELFVALPVQSKGKEFASYIKLTGARRAWKSADKADFVYIPKMYIAGTPDNIRTVLRFWVKSGKAGNFTNQTIDDMLAGNTSFNVYSAENTQKGEDLHGAFEAELAEINAKRSKKAADYASLAPSSFAIQTYAALVGAALRGGSFHETEAEAMAASKGSGKKEKPAPLTKKEKLAAALEEARDEDKIVDVSDVGADEDKDPYVGYKTKKDGKHNVNNHWYLPEYPFVDSKTELGYRRAMEALIGDKKEVNAIMAEAKLAARAAATSGGAEEVEVPQASRAGSRRNSPRGSTRVEEEEEESESEGAGSPAPKPKGKTSPGKGAARRR